MLGGDNISTKHGYLNEYDFINYLNKKQFKELNILMQEFITVLYPNIKNNDIINAYKYGRYAKVDMVIEVNNIKKGISIKCGAKNSVHVEPIDKFILYLKKNNFTETDKLLRYLYSDGTNNNTGIIRQSASEYRTDHLEDITAINNELEKLTTNLIKRFLTNTDINYKTNVDAFISGTLNDFMWCTLEEVILFLSDNQITSQGIHVSTLFIQNWNKNLNYNERYEYCRNYIQVKWYSMFDDIIKIMINRKNSL